MKKLFILGIVAALACAAYAYPTLTGPTGYTNLPTATVAPAGDLILAADYYNNKDIVGKTTYPVRLLYGIGGNWEVGAAYISSEENGWDLNAKYKIPVDFAGFALGAGAQYLRYSRSGESLTFEQAYLAGTREFTKASASMPGFSGTLGLNWTQAKFTGESSESAIRFYAGLEAAFTNKLALSAEYQTKSDKLDDKALWSIAARYPFTPALSAQVGFTNNFFGLDGADKNKIFVGVDYAFNTAAK